MDNYFDFIKIWIYKVTFTRLPFLNEAAVLITGTRGTSRYQYGHGLGDVLRGIVYYIPKIANFLKLVVMKGAQTFLKAGSEAINEGATVKDVVMSVLKPTTGVVLGATFDQVVFKLLEMRDNHTSAPPPNLPIVMPEIVQAGSGKKHRHAPVYNKSPKRKKYSSKHRPIIYKF